MTAKNIKQIMREENHTERLYWFTLSKSYIQSSVKPLSIHYASNHRFHIHHTQRGDFEFHKVYSPSLHTTNTSSQNHTDFTGFYNSCTESNIYNYKHLNRLRKHLESQYIRTLLISYLNHNKAQRQSCEKLVKTFPQTVCNISNQSQSEYQTFLFHQSFYVQRKTHL